MIWPRGLFGRLLLIMFVGLGMVQVLTFLLVFVERGLVTRGIMVAYVTADIASSVAMLDRLPASERRAWLPRLQRSNYRLVLDADARTTPTLYSESHLVRSVAVALSQALSQRVTALRSPVPDVDARLAIHLQDGTPVAVDLVQPGWRLSGWLVAALGLQLAVIGAASWIAVKQTTRPLARLADAAQALEPGRPSPPLPETGPREIAQASSAFNLMSRRIGHYLDERSQMLGAISHDLQTPITRMRLRIELVPDAMLRDKLQADLEQMQHLVEQGLTYAQSAQAIQESEVSTALIPLLESIVADYQDASQPVTWLGGECGDVITRPHALRRVIGNLIDNALKFGGAAQVQLVVTDQQPTVLIMDRGPGIAAGELSKVFQPFYRVEGSRNTMTGGSGLGLAIVKRLVGICHAELHLGPRQGGGLVASIRFARKGAFATSASRNGDSNAAPAAAFKVWQ